MAKYYCLSPQTNFVGRAARTGECTISTDCVYKAHFFGGLSKETDLLLRNMCAIQMQNEKILTLLQQQKKK